MKQKTIVYVLNKKGKPLMPTTRCGRVHKLLKAGLAVPVNNNPFTIRLKYETPDIVQSLTVGIDTGRENIGEGVSDDEGNCYFLCETETHNKSIKKKMSERAEHRHARRHHARQKKQRKALKDNNAIKNGDDDVLRSKKACKSVSVSYPGMDESITSKVIRGKEAQFNNRKRPDDWITPSGRQLIQMTLGCLKQTMKILPISKVVLERVCFDFQKLENENIKNWEYGKGPLYGFKDYKEYIDEEQNHKCLLCGKNHIHHYHHIVPRSKDGSDTVKNIAGLCDECHNGIDGVHKNDAATEQLLTLKTGIHKQYHISLLNSVIPQLIQELTDFCNINGLEFAITDGMTTAKTRATLKLEKTHAIDVYCISREGKNNKKVVLIPATIYHRRRYKKKSSNNIQALNSRKYYFNGQLVATNRHKAMEQKAPSLEEYMDEYAQTHTELECRQHIHQLTIKPAKRTYTFHKQQLIAPIHAGDKVRYKKINKVNKKTKTLIFITDSVDMSNNKACHGTQNKRLKYCQRIESRCIPYIT